MSNLVFLSGNHIKLRPITSDDINERYIQWLNDADVSAYNSHGTFPYTREKAEAYFASLNNQSMVVLAIVDNATNQHVGNIALQNIHWVNRHAEFAILLGDKESWGKGIASEAARLIVEYGFTRLNLHRIYAGTLDGNQAMIALAKKLGMKEEGRRREAAFKNGQYLDVIEFGVLQQEFARNA